MGTRNEYPQSMFCAVRWKISDFLSKNFHFLVVKFSLYLNRLVFVMQSNHLKYTILSIITVNLSELYIWTNSDIKEGKNTLETDKQIGTWSYIRIEPNLCSVYINSPWPLATIHDENMPLQIYWKFTTKKWKFSDKKFWYFSCFCSKHRLWVLVRTASKRRF